LDRKDFAGGVVADIEESMRFIQRNTRTAYRIEKLQREEIPEYPMTALREAVTNAVMHRDWFLDGANVFIEISEDRIEVSSPGGLPGGMRPEDLGSKSVRRNPLIADLLHRIDFIEKAGTGIRRMRDGAKELGSPEPAFAMDGFFTATFRPIAIATGHEETREAGESTPQVGTKSGPSRDQVRILAKCVQDSSMGDLLALASRTNRTKFRDQVINPLISAGLIEMTIPDKPRSPKQRYRSTAAGRRALEDSKKGPQS
jgi:ATP-dependent DNA helicase RecG